MSLVGVYDAEWRTRKINLFHVLRSFIYQLSPNEELTRVSLPSELCHPFSMLELIAYRELQLFHILFEINSCDAPLDRFLIILKWYMGMVREETVEKKPFNPVIGEYHLCWVDHGNGDFSEFIGEQVSHHPPVTAFVVRNKQANVRITGDVTFAVGLGTNCATVTTGGKVIIHTSKGNYCMSKCMPDMMVNNVIWGDKYLMWVGGVTISCVESGYSAYIELKEVEHRNLISGKIYDPENNVIFNLSGIAGHVTNLQRPDSNELKPLVDISTYVENKISYIPVEAQDDFNTLKVWKPVVDAIIKNDMTKADATKKVIEADQRIRESDKKASGKINEGTYFYRTADAQNSATNWNFRDNVELNTAFMDDLNKKVQVEKVRKQREAEELAKNIKELPKETEKDEESDCTIQ